MILIASACAGLAVMFTTFVIIDMMSEASAKYKEKYIQEAAVELDDVLLQMPPNKIFDVSLAIAALGAFLGIAIMGLCGASMSYGKVITVGVLVAIISFQIPRLYLKYLRKQRMVKFNEQLEDALTSMSSSLKAGFSINQALEVIADENKKPISVEFRLLMQEMRLGVPLDDALRKMVNRLDSPDMELVATAIITARQTGGELTSILERLASVIRERTRIEGKLRAITAQGKLQAYLIGAMPFLLVTAMMYVAPAMMTSFFNSIVGILIAVAAVITVIIGFLVIRKITTIDI